MAPHIPAMEPPRFSEDIATSCSTPFVSAPSSPDHDASGYYYSAPASPMHLLLTDHRSQPHESTPDYEPIFLSSDSGSFEFEFSSRFSPNGYGRLGSMVSADELFFNGQIRPMTSLSAAPPVMDLNDAACSRGVDPRRGKFANRRARSMSPLRFGRWRVRGSEDRGNEERESDSGEATPSSSSSRSSSSGRNSKKWIFLKDLLNRSKSEGRASGKERFWSVITFSPSKEKSTPPPPPSDDKMEMKPPAKKKPTNGARRHTAASAHELHYTAKRAQVAEMRKKTFLPYRQGVLGCLGFSSKSYGAFTGFTRNFNPLSSR